MPLSWKKSRVIRISRLVADLHRPPKRGSSFLLQTGFPTSLLDLFVKNRDRFKPSAKRSTTHTPVPTPSPPPLYHHDRDSRPAVETLTEILPPTQSSPMADQIEAGRGASGNILFMDVLKMFVILGLALGAAQFAWAMAAAAFSLLSLEFLGKSRAGFWHLKGRTREGIVASYGMNAASEREEITQVMESDNLTTSQDIKTQRDFVHESSRGQRPRESKSRPNLIKKLVKRKLQHGKKREQNSIVVETVEEVIAERSEETRKADVGGSKDTEKPRTEIEIDTAGESEKQRKDWKKRNNFRNTILLMIVLCGLIGGRIPALLVTVSWGLILRYVERATT